MIFRMLYMDNRDKIIEIAFLLSLKNGFDRVSIKRIQDESGIAVGSIYYYFNDKNEILVSIIKKYFIGIVPEFKEAVKDFNGSFMEKMYFVFTYKANCFNKEKFHLNSLASHEFNNKNYFMLGMSIFHQYPEARSLFYELNEELHDFYNELIQEAIEKGEIREDIDIKALNVFIRTLLEGYIDLWLNQSEFSFEDIVEDNMKMLWEAIKK